MEVLCLFCLTGDIGLKWFGTLPSTGVSLFIFLTTEYNFDQGYIVWILLLLSQLFQRVQ